MKRIRLSELAADRGLVGGPFGSSLVSRDYVEAGIPVIRGANMGSGRYLDGDFVYVTPQKLAQDLSRNTARAGDIVFTQRGTLGQVALVPETNHEIYVISQSQMRLRVDPEKGDPGYIYYAATSSDFLNQINDRAISTGVPHTNLGILAELEVPDLPLPEQQAIAEVLGALDDKIAANTKLAANADQLASTTLENALSQDRVPLASLAKVTMGTSPKGEALNEMGEGVPFFQGVRDFGFRFPSKRVFTSAPVRMAQIGDLLLSVRAPVGQINVADEDSCIGRGLAAVRSTQGTQSTLFHQLRIGREAWIPFEAEGTVFGSINRDQLNSIQVRTVPSEIALVLELQLSGIEKVIESALLENRALSATRDALLPQLMSGKLRIRDVEHAVSEVGA